MSSPDTSLEELNRWMRAHHLHGYWMQEGGGPGAQVKPHLWKWADIHAGLLQTGDAPGTRPSGTTEAHTIGLDNPTQGSVPRSFSLSLQMLMPGERTPSHGIGSNEMFFVIQAPPGAVFTVDGEAFPLEAGDLIVSPAGTECDHSNGGNEPAIWLDAQDAVLRSFLGAVIDAEPALDGRHRANDQLHPPGSPQPAVAKPTGYFSATHERMRAPGVSSTFRRPPVRYRRTDTYATLMALREGEAGADPHDGIHLRYTSLTDGDSTLPTFSCEIQLLTPALHAYAHRHNSTATYYVVRGEGRTEVAGEWLEWARGDIFSIPPWTWHRHENPAREAGILYSVDDWPAMAKMGFYRTEGGEA